MTTPQPLPPAAQAVRQAYGDCIGGVDAVMGSEWRGLAAALRALADRLQIKEPLGKTDIDAGVYAAHHAIRAEILAIAAELEGGR